MRTLTTWLCVFVLISGFLVARATPAAATESLFNWGGNIARYERTVAGVILESRLEIYPPSARDERFRATDWNLASPEAVWFSTTRALPELTDRDRTRFFVDIPGMVRNILEVGLTTDQNLTTRFTATHVAGKGYAIDFRPGDLKLGAVALMAYVVHENDRGGISILFFTIEWAQRGEIGGGFHLGVRQAPPDFDDLPTEIRAVYRSGFRPVNAEATLDPQIKARIDAYRQQRDAQRAQAHAETRLRQLIAGGEACSICAAVRGEIHVHPDGICPALHPSRRQTSAAQPTPVTRASSRPLSPPAGQSLMGGRPTDAETQPDGQFYYDDRLVTDNVTIPYAERDLNRLALRWQGKAVHLRYLYGGRPMSAATRTDNHIVFNLEHWTAGQTWVIETRIEDAAGRLAPPIRLRIQIR